MSRKGVEAPLNYYVALVSHLVLKDAFWLRQDRKAEFHRGVSYLGQVCAVPQY